MTNLPLTVLRKRYLDLVEDILLNSIYEDGSIGPIASATHDPAIRDSGSDWPASAHTMIGRARLHNLRTLAERMIAKEVEGDFLEAGVWRGGACIMMAAVVAAHESDKNIYVADSFCGVPPPAPDRFPADARDEHFKFAQLAVPLEQVQRNFRKYALLRENVIFVPGLFSETLKGNQVSRLSILRVDADLYESTMDVLSVLYDKVSVGGAIIIDDYGAVPGCFQAINEFRAAKNVRETMQKIDWTGVYWFKS